MIWIDVDYLLHVVFLTCTPQMSHHLLSWAGFLGLDGHLLFLLLWDWKINKLYGIEVHRFTCVQNLKYFLFYVTDFFMWPVHRLKDFRFSISTTQMNYQFHTSILYIHLPGYLPPLFLFIKQTMRSTRISKAMAHISPINQPCVAMSTCLLVMAAKNK